MHIYTAKDNRDVCSYAIGGPFWSSILAGSISQDGSKSAYLVEDSGRLSLAMFYNDSDFLYNSVNLDLSKMSSQLTPIILTRA